jgi:NAD(P)-dependent dehydrogenase (short-subunit alcohol dehydrogenase family)
VSLAGRVALVTGGGRGIGAAVARALAAEGALPFLVARTAPELERVAAGIDASGERVGYAVEDVSDAAGVERAMQRCLATLGAPAVLVNAAAVHGPIGPAWEADPAEWWRACSVNLLGTMLCCRAVIPSMLAAGFGRIINFAGGGATTPRPRFSAYAASKAAVVRLTETLAEELRGSGVTVNAISPGTVDTRLQDDVIAAGARAGADYSVIERLRAGGAGGVPAELAASLSVFIASDAAAPLSGKLLSAPHDGWTAWDHAQVAMLANSPWFTLRRLDPFTVRPLPPFPGAGEGLAAP